ncbi:hypothetical protein DEO72_LG2g3 [Vigna unguiculata]|uniref:Uncharacterized protein n=1 Tax=Vigna unguiculata TaxID=3917 RepID=A0A4D6KWF8_VIGUN|nr:hypothetical protein DEO72_LG2g3 [Vigna unguiculata]
MWIVDFLITFIPSRRRREVKLRAFSDANHRTLRDLKQFYVHNIPHNSQLKACDIIKRHVAEVIDKKICNEGHQTESVSVHIPSTQEQEGPSIHTILQCQTRRPLSVDEEGGARLSYELSRMQTTRLLEI